MHRVAIHINYPTGLFSMFKLILENTVYVTVYDISFMKTKEAISQPAFLLILFCILGK